MLNHALSAEKMRGHLGRIGHVVLVLSGKGGVGKSTCSVHIALAFRRKGFRVRCAWRECLNLDLCSLSLKIDC